MIWFLPVHHIQYHSYLIPLVKAKLVEQIPFLIIRFIKFLLTPIYNLRLNIYSVRQYLQNFSLACLHSFFLHRISILQKDPAIWRNAVRQPDISAYNRSFSNHHVSKYRCPCIYDLVVLNCRMSFLVWFSK